MKRTLLFVLALITAGCADPIPRNLDDLSIQGPQYLDPETLEPYSGPAYRMSEDDPTEIVLRVNLRDGRTPLDSFEAARSRCVVPEGGLRRPCQANDKVAEVLVGLSKEAITLLKNAGPLDHLQE
jgi:hypothetical protein